jgi:hypothetical protein
VQAIWSQDIQPERERALARSLGQRCHPSAQPWACKVESDTGDVYGKVDDAERPEGFFKAIG